MANIGTLASLFRPELCKHTATGKHIFVAGFVLGKIKINNKVENLYSTKDTPICVACKMIDDEAIVQDNDTGKL